MRLNMSDIRKSFASGEVLHGVNFTLQPGEIHALVGHNGAGKSTLMKILAGVYPDYRGQIMLDGEAVSLSSPKDAHRHGIATIHQDFSLIPALSVAENIALGREPVSRWRGFLSRRTLRARSAQEAMAAGIALPMDTPVGQLGVAEQQLTEIVRALSRQARILIMDEPTARLAPAERQHLFALMRRLAASGVAIIYISHFLEEVIDNADRVTVLRDGAVVASDGVGHFSVDHLTRLLVGDEAPLRDITPPHQGGATALQLRGFGVAGRATFDLALQQGEIVALAGLVGSGRTRLVRAMIGDVPMQGEIRLNGQPLQHITPQQAARQGMLLVPEDRKINGLVATGSVADNIVLTALDGELSHRGWLRHDRRRELVAEAMQRFRIHPAQPERNITTLSGGNAQKALLARAASARPKVLILDQPTAGVDIGAKSELHHQIRVLAASGMAVILITDDLDELLELSGRVLVIRQGSVTKELPRQGMNHASLLAAMSTSI